MSRGYLSGAVTTVISACEFTQSDHGLCFSLVDSTFPIKGHFKEEC